MRIASLSSGLLLWAFLALPCAVNAKGADNDRFEEKISDMKKKREDALGDYEAIAAKEAVTHKNEIQVKLKDFKKSPSSSSEFVKIQSELQISDKEFLEKVSEVKEEFKKKLMDISPAYTELGEKIKEVIDKNDVKDKDLPLNTWANEAKDSKELIDGYLRDLDSEVSASICCAVDNLKDQLSTKDLQMLTNDVLVAINNVLITSGAAYYGKSSPSSPRRILSQVSAETTQPQARKLIDSTKPLIIAPNSPIMRTASLSSGLLLWAFLALSSWAANVHGKGSVSFEEKIREMKKKRENALEEYEVKAAYTTATHEKKILVTLEDFNAWMQVNKKNPPISEFVNFLLKFQSFDKSFLEKVSKMKEHLKTKLTDIISLDYGYGTKLGEEIKEAIDTNDVKYNGLPLNAWANEIEDSNELIEGYVRDLDSEVSASICCAVDNLNDQFSTEDLQMLSNYVLVAINNVLVTSGAAYYGKSSPLAEQNWLEDFDSARHLKKKGKGDLTPEKAEQTKPVAKKKTVQQAVAKKKKVQQAVAKKKKVEQVANKKKVEQVANKKKVEQVANKKKVEQVANKKKVEQVANKKKVEQVANKKKVEQVQKKNKKNKKEIVLNDYSGHLMMKFDPVFTCIDCFDPDVANEFQMWIIDGMPNVVQTHLASVFEIVLQDQMANKKVKTTCSPCGAWSPENNFKESDLEIVEYVILAKQRKAVNTFMLKLQEIDYRFTVAGKPCADELLTCFNKDRFNQCDPQYIDCMDMLYNKFQEEADVANEVLVKELDMLSERIITIYEELDGYVARLHVQNEAEQSMKAIRALISKKRAEYEDNVVCDIDGLRESLTEGQFRKMERIFQITTNYALVQAGFFDVTIKDVVIDEQCLIENNMCINATDTDRRMLTSRKQNILFARTQRIFQQMRTGHCTICPRRSLPSNAMRRRSGRKLQAKVAKASKAPNVAKASKEPTAPKEPKASKEQFSDVRYSNFFEETVSEEYAKKLATQQDLLANPDGPIDDPSDVATFCRLYGNFLNEEQFQDI
eukprot:CAMPEP_0198303360 /NCGR_PEP_ID=MMETSP1449-20131203/56844_1 /TAXON_ID=420275 /ORGANISM="Attheya septentrionalis, Strain CCMP2084" /LENGTH=1027 /DNA_ID=CAMNT_0044005849 /DNA_START=86 /DNA_END=3171 /DNA_ORIENTATION=-